uniref:Uncharacterized protein n=1 Tax=viral metagenome TaxID=1070528 RepID=A0A6C0ABY8_9ZZZZ
MSNTLFSRLFKSIELIKGEFIGHPLADVIDYFQNSYDSDKFKIKLTRLLFNELYSDWMSKGDKLDKKLNTKKNIEAKILIIKYTLKAMSKYNTFVIDNKIDVVLPIIIVDESEKDIALKQLARVCIENINMSEVVTERDLLNQLRLSFETFIVSENFMGTFNMFSNYIRDLKRLFSEKNLEKLISLFVKVFKNTTPSQKRGNDSRSSKDNNQNDPKRPKK